MKAKLKRGYKVMRAGAYGLALMLGTCACGPSIPNIRPAARQGPGLCTNPVYVRILEDTAVEVADTAVLAVHFWNRLAGGPVLQITAEPIPVGAPVVLVTDVPSSEAHGPEELGFVVGRVDGPHACTEMVLVGIISERCKTPLRLQWVVYHEFGHVLLGNAHNSSRGALMGAHYPSDAKSIGWLSDEERATLNRRYAP